VQYDQGYGTWTTACSLADSTGTISGTCSSFPSSPISRIRILKTSSDNCWSAVSSDNWYRLTGVKLTGRLCQVCGGTGGTELAISQVTCQSNDYYGGWRSGTDCTSEIAHSDYSTWNDAYGVHFTQWGSITLPASHIVGKVEVFHYQDNACPYSLQYNTGNGVWTTACSITSYGTEDICFQNFPSSGITGLRVLKNSGDNCWTAVPSDTWYRLTGIKVTTCGTTR